MDILKKLIILIGSIIMVGCATVTGGGNSQTISVNTVNEYGVAVQGAVCNLSNDKGNWKLSSPDQVTITKSDKAMIVRCEKAPSEPGIATVESSVRGALFGNIIAGGLIGAAIDHTSGAGYEYPEFIKVMLGMSTGYKIQSDQRQGADRTPITRILPPATGFASVKDVDRLPIQDAAVIKGYNDFLNYKGPKAFAVSQDKATGWALGIMAADNKDQQARDPGERALANCRRRATTPCVLYAVDEQVVYTKPNFLNASTQQPAALQTVASSNSLAAPQTASQPVAQPAMLATGFANIADVDAIPYINDRGREAYREWLTKPTPRAFVISDTGRLSSTWGINPQNPEEPKDPAQRALQRCAKVNNAPCKLYAVNGAVVYVKDTQPAGAVSTAPAEIKPAPK